MSDERGLLAAIWEHPHEDTPRLMYADWLDEHGHAPRAEFIRAQCERARLDPWDDAERVAELEKREAVLWKPNVKGWKANLPQKLQNAPFRRGFVYPRPIGLSGSQFVKLKPNALDDAPQWTATLRTLGRHFAKVFASPLLLRFNELSIEWTNYSGDLLADLAGNERLRSVTDLFIVNDNPPESVTAFYSGPATANLSRLFAGNLNPAAFLALAATPTAQRLKYLSFWLTQPHDRDGWAACHLGAAQFPRLRSLKFHYSGRALGESASVAGLLTAAPTAPLARIEMNWCRVTDDDTEALAAWPGLASVRELELEFNELGARGFLALARSPFAGGLKLLKLDEWSLREIPDVKAELDARFGPAVRYR